MIFDCFPFFRELDLLEMRLELLDAHVDRFVLCEAPYTFRGVPKPLYYAENKARFARWADRIEHLVYAEPPVADPWINDWRQRAHLTTGLAAAAPDDHVIVSDLDEIPALENVAVRATAGRVLAHRQLWARGYFNRVCPERWVGTRSLTFRDLGERNLNDVRFIPWGDELEFIDGGWHFTSLGGADVFAEKFSALAHIEADIPYQTDRDRLRLEYATESATTRWVPFDDEFPPELHDPRWSRYVWAKPEPRDPQLLETLAHAHGCFAYVPGGASLAVLTAPDGDAGEGWEIAGRQRFAHTFVGCSASPDEVQARLPAGGWLVIDGHECLSVDALRRLARSRFNVVAFARNTRSFDMLEATVKGAAFPAGPALGTAEIEARFAAAEWTIERRDPIIGTISFPTPSLPDLEPFTLDLGWLRLHAMTRATLDDLVASAVIYVLRPAAVP